MILSYKLPLGSVLNQTCDFTLPVGTPIDNPLISYPRGFTKVCLNPHGADLEMSPDVKRYGKINYYATYAPHMTIEALKLGFQRHLFAGHLRPLDLDLLLRAFLQ